MARRETKNSADSRLAYSEQKAILVCLHRRFWLQRRKIVVENKAARVPRISLATSTFITRTEITVLIVFGELRRRPIFNLSLPGARSPLRRNQDPFARERVVATMWMLS